jgi:hypothetical protein
LDVLIGSL